MPYIGRDTDKISNVEVLDNITFDGSSSYTLQKGGSNFTPSSANTLLLSIDGVVQAGNFTVSGSTIDFGTAVAGTSTCDFVLHYGVGLITTVSDGTVTTAKLADDAVTAAKINNDIISGSTELTTAPADTDEFLVSDAGTLKRIDYSLIKGGGAFELISTTTISSSVASVDFDTLSTDYRDFKIVISSLVIDTHQEAVLIKVKRSGQSSFDGGSGEYRFNTLGNRSQDGNTIFDGSNSNNKIQLNATSIARDATVDGSTFNATINVVDPHGTTNTKFFYWNCAYVEGTYGATASNQGAGYRYDTSETALIGVQIAGGGSTQFTSGTVTLYGRKI